jgi:hypothetical protein
LEQTGTNLSNADIRIDMDDKSVEDGAAKVLRRLKGVLT